MKKTINVLSQGFSDDIDILSDGRRRRLQEEVC